MSDKDKGVSIFSKLQLRVPDLKTMFPVKSEIADPFDVGKDSQHIRLKDGYPHISDTVNVNTSENQYDKKLREEMLLTVAYVKNESASNASDYNTSDSTGNEVINGQNLTDINVIKNEKKEACNYNTSGDVTDIKTEKTEAYNYDTSGDVTDDEHDTVHVKQEVQHYNVEEHNINLVPDISQHERVDGSDIINMEDICPPSATQSRYKTHKHILKRIHSAEKRYKCDLCAFRAKTSWTLLRHKRIHTGEKPYRCEMCDYSTTQYGNLKRHKLKHTEEKPYKCDVCDYSTTTSGHLKTHKLLHTGEKPYKCDVCDYSTTTSGHLKTHKLIHSVEKPYKCDLCEYSTTQSCHLKRHKVKHSREKRHK